MIFRLPISGITGMPTLIGQDIESILSGGEITYFFYPSLNIFVKNN